MVITILIISFVLFVINFVTTCYGINGFAEKASTLSNQLLLEQTIQQHEPQTFRGLLQQLQPMGVPVAINYGTELNITENTAKVYLSKLYNVAKTRPDKELREAVLNWNQQHMVKRVKE